MVDREELLKRARALVPVLRERASLAEELRRLPKETVDDLHAAELMRAAQPKRFGGFDLDYGIVLEIAQDLDPADRERLARAVFQSSLYGIPLAQILKKQEANFRLG